MTKHLYLLKDQKLAARGSPFFFSVEPTCKGSYQDYSSLERKISLKCDLKWGETEHLQKIFRGADIWTNFPAEGLKFIAAELKAGDEDQRIDLLYLRDDGGLYPCELKIGDSSLDSHGQLIRYIADLYYQTINIQWLLDTQLRYISNKGETDTRLHDIEAKKLHDFLLEKGINDHNIRLLRNSGIILSEAFKSQTVKAVRYLNEQACFSIRLLRLDTYVAENWNIAQPEYIMRIDIVEI